MDDSCAVCAGSLEWVAYGACGHKDVCSTCIARLRFICNDRHCCICKTETDVVFVTKALGDYTKTISDFTVFPSKLREGKVGQYWYHEDTQAFFDDSDHYKMIKAMCKLSCSKCDKTKDQTKVVSRRRTRFRNVHHLKGHLFHKHRLIMCILCLEERKVFICEQKLYTRSQLNQHINTGDSEVDGIESERGGFSGHPFCEFCQKSFYGDNEIYRHMSTQHYTCHICQRQHPGQDEYYKNYDDLEIHFGRDHFLCEDDSCLVKKFIVFQSESEIKRHNALEHGGHKSCSQRSAALQIPTSFCYRQSIEQENCCGRACTFCRDLSDNDLSFAIQASLESANADYEESTGVDSLISPLESITTDSDTPSRYRQAVSQRSFPPLALGPGGYQQNSQTDALSRKSMGAHLAWPTASCLMVQPVMNWQTEKKVSSPSSGPSWQAGTRTPAQPVFNSHGWLPVNVISGSASTLGQSIAFPEIGSISSSRSTVQIHPPSVATSSFAYSLMPSRDSGSNNPLSHSSSTPSLSERQSFESSRTGFPPVSAVAQSRKPTTNDQAVWKAGNIHVANKSLREKMCAALDFDEDKITAFKDISNEYLLDSIDVETYLTYVDQFGLSHLVLDLAAYLPNPQKQKELADAYNLQMSIGASRKEARSNGLKDSNGSKNGRGKGKSVDTGNIIKNSLVHNNVRTVRQLQSIYNAQEEEVKVLSKDGYLSARSQQSKAMVGCASPLESTKPRTQIESLYAAGGRNQGPANSNWKDEKQKKPSKFHRARLGDGSVEGLLDLRNPKPVLDSEPGEASSNGPERECFCLQCVEKRQGQQLPSTKLEGKKERECYCPRCVEKRQGQQLPSTKLEGKKERECFCARCVEKRQGQQLPSTNLEGKKERECFCSRCVEKRQGQ